MAAKTVGFAIADEDRKALDELVAFYGGGNRSEFLRVVIKKMRRERWQQRLVGLQQDFRKELNGKVYSEQEILDLCKVARRKIG
jgi:metal-responsive CopG/Arc/MetJ family transcriptional regulator